MHGPHRITLRTRRWAAFGGSAFLAVAGELDLATAERFRETVTGILAEPGLARLVLDVDRLEFLDSTGGNALVAGLRTATERGIDYRVVNANPRVLELLQLLGLDELLIPDAPY